MNTAGQANRPRIGSARIKDVMINPKFVLKPAANTGHNGVTRKGKKPLGLLMSDSAVKAPSAPRNPEVRGLRKFAVSVTLNSK